MEENKYLEWFFVNLGCFLIFTIIMSIVIYYVVIPMLTFNNEGEPLLKFLSDLSGREILVSVMIANIIIYPYAEG